MRLLLAAALALLHVQAAETFGAVGWVGTLGALLLATSGRARVVGAGLVSLGALTAFGLLALGATRAVANFGPETDKAALEVVASAAAGLTGALAFTALLGFLPDKIGPHRGGIVGWVLAAASAGSTVGLAAVAAWLGTAAFWVQQALSRLSTVQTMQCWGPAAGSVALWLLVAARSPRVGLVSLGVGVGALLVSSGLGPGATFVVAPGRDAIPGMDAKTTARQARRQQVVPGFAVPVVKERPQRVDEFRASGGDRSRLDRGWSPGPELSPEAIRHSVREGAAFLTRNQQAGGRFTYIVKANGESGSGYNYPRHAGTAWFLAREAVALTDPAAEATARRALQHLDDVSGHTPDGRAFILDPARSDGKAWIGTTALAVLAVEVLDVDGLDVDGLEVDGLEVDGPEVDGLEVDGLAGTGSARGWKQQVIASVDADGKVRGEMTTATGEFIDGDVNGYGQGQAMLALAAIARGRGPGAASAELADRALRDGALAALQRSSLYVGSARYYGAHPLWVGDEHWMCLAAHAIHSVNAGRSAGAKRVDPAGPDVVCRTYATMLALASPPRGAGLPPSAGSVAGGAEAVIARAWDTGTGLTGGGSTGSPPARSLIASPLGAASLEYGQMFLNSQYHADDATLTPALPTLLGGYRNGPYDLDVQIDTVQHIGGALLGILALVEGEDGPGRLP